MTEIVALIGLGLNVIGSLVLINSNKELIRSIVNSFKRIERNMTWDKLSDDEWFPNGWESDFTHVVKNSTRSTRFAFFTLAVGFILQFIATLLH